MVQHTDALDAGTELELTYNGQRGSRTIPVEVVDVTPQCPTLDEYDDQRIRVRDLDRGDRYLRFTVDADGTWSYENVRSENSKSPHGRRLGELEHWEITGHAETPHVERLAVVEDAAEGDRLRVMPEDDRDAFVATVVQNKLDSSFTRLETADGDRSSLCCSARGITFDSRPARVEAAGRHDRADEAAPKVAQSWLRGLRGGQAVTLGETTWFVVRCHSAGAVSLADEYHPDEYQAGELTLTADCLGLRAGNISEGYERLPTEQVLRDNEFTEATFGPAALDAEH